jgi:hypothetical protein
MVPYREIRETIKNSQATQRQVKLLRQTHGDAAQYLGIYDADLEKLRLENNDGTFSHYDRLIAQHYTRPLSKLAAACIRAACIRICRRLGAQKRSVHEST